MSDRNQNSIGASMIYKSLEKYISLGFQTVVQLVVARILSPNDYGIVAMMTVFIAIARVFIENGFNMALVQKKDLDREDSGTAFFLNTFIGVLLYFILYICAPYISAFYREPELTKSLRILAIILPLSSISAIQTAIETREMHFKTLFKCNLLSSVISGLLSIVLALNGFGFWTLVIQQISSILIFSLTLYLVSRWLPPLCFSKARAAQMWKFGSKLLFAQLINQIYKQLNSLVIGKQYTKADLSFYTKGNSLPMLLTNGVEMALNSVSYSAFSRIQNDIQKTHYLLRKTLIVNTGIIVPIMTVFAFAAKPIIVFILTDKWIQVVPYLQICCFTCMFHPLGAITGIVATSMGRSDIRLKLEFIKKPMGVVLLLFALPHGPLAIAISAAVTSVLSLIISLFVCEKIVKYPVSNQIKDIIPTFLTAGISGLVMMMLDKFISLSPFGNMMILSFAGLATYILISVVFKLESFVMIKEQLLKLKK